MTEGSRLAAAQGGWSRGGNFKGIGLYAGDVGLSESRCTFAWRTLHPKSHRSTPYLQLAVFSPYVVFNNNVRQHAARRAFFATLSGGRKPLCKTTFLYHFTINKHMNRLFSFASIALISITIFMLAPLQHSVHDCSKWLAKETVILPAQADYPALPHTFISESGTMTLNSEFPDDQKDACTRALHSRLEIKPGRQLKTSGGTKVASSCMNYQQCILHAGCVYPRFRRCGLVLGKLYHTALCEC